jgi:hypothetical protein
MSHAMPGRQRQPIEPYARSPTSRKLWKATDQTYIAHLWSIYSGISKKNFPNEGLSPSIFKDRDSSYRIEIPIVLKEILEICSNIHRDVKLKNKKSY